MGVPMEGLFDGADVVFATPAPSTTAHKVPAKTLTPSAEPVPREEGIHIEGVGETTPLPAKTPAPPERAISPTVVQTKTAPSVLPLVISTSDPFAAISQAAKGGASLVVTPSSIPGSATRGPDTDLSSEGSDDILEDPDDVPTLKKRISDSDEEESASPKPNFMGMYLSSPTLSLFFCTCVSFARLSPYLQRLLRGQELQQAWDCLLLPHLYRPFLSHLQHLFQPYQLLLLLLYLQYLFLLHPQPPFLVALASFLSLLLYPLFFFVNLLFLDHGFSFCLAIFFFFLCI